MKEWLDEGMVGPFAGTMPFLCAFLLNYPTIYSLSRREKGYKHARNCVYLGKIENSSYNQELVSHPMPECVDELSSLI